MSSHGTGRQPDERPVIGANEADAAEQAVPSTPDDLDIDPFEAVAPEGGGAPLEANGADVWEQTLTVADPDDDYEHDSR